MEKKDFFKNKAKDYDFNASRSNNASGIAKIILEENNLQDHMHIMDFGSGTGLLLENVAPYIKKVTAVDISQSMTAVLVSKRHEIKCELEVIEEDITKNSIQGTYDGIISSMTIHHIEDIEELFNIFYNLLCKGGTIGLADLDIEDGSFHDEDTGVFHLGFDRDYFIEVARKAGFKNLKIQTAHIIEKNEKKYPVFLLTGRK